MKVIVVGCHGQMGQPICRFVDEREGMELVGGVGPAGRDYIGRDLGQVAGLGRDLGIPVTDDLASIIGECDALIDVSSVEQCLETLDLAVEHGKALVTASTGFTLEQFARFEAAGERIPVIFKCNTSKMVNVMLALVETAARALADECDIEIIDQHDRDKLDAPSGTAVIIGTMIAELKGTTLDELAEYGRGGHGARLGAHRVLKRGHGLPVEVHVGHAGEQAVHDEIADTVVLDAGLPGRAGQSDHRPGQRVLGIGHIGRLAAHAGAAGAGLALCHLLALEAKHLLCRHRHSLSGRGPCGRVPVDRRHRCAAVVKVLARQGIVCCNHNKRSFLQ